MVRAIDQLLHVSDVVDRFGKGNGEVEDVAVRWMYPGTVSSTSSQYTQTLFISIHGQ